VAPINTICANLTAPPLRLPIFFCDKILDLLGACVMARRLVNYKTIGGFKVLSQWRDDNGFIRFTLICKVCGKEFDRSFSCLNKYKIKSCGCNREFLKPLPDYINGFKVIEDLGTGVKGKDRRAIVECKMCRRIYEARVTKLRYNRSCGCAKGMGRPINRYRKSHPRLAHIYSGMKTRCYNQKIASFKHYGGRGISICDEWLKDSNLFCEWALSNGYKDDLTIDRIDNDKGYSPDNCRWVTYAVNTRNTRVVKMSMPLARKIRESDMKPLEIAKKYDVKLTSVYDIRLGRSWREESSGGAN
jgi:transcription elongation factor Elf1